MKIALLSALFTISVFAQHRNGAPAAVAPRPSAPPPVIRPVSPQRPPSRPIAPPTRPVSIRPSYSRPVYIPYPVYYSNYTAEQVQAPAAYVNPEYRPETINPILVDYSNIPLPEPVSEQNQSALRDDQPTIFLIALTDQTVLVTIAYWAEDDTLYWISRDAKQNQLSLSLVDRDLSKQLNDERHVEFKLPPVK